MVESRKSSQGSERKRLHVALLGASEEWYTGVAGMLSVYPDAQCQHVPLLRADLHDFASAVAARFNAAVLDVDSDPEYASHLARELSAQGNIYVMACSVKSDVKLVIRFMHAGVREFFTLPVDPNEVVAALKRAAEQPATPPSGAKPLGKLFVFLGAKGGVGVTTLAANFALTTAQMTKKKTLVIDFGLPLGDVAINLGMQTQYSVMNALLDPGRLDGSFLDSIVSKHESGLDVLGAPAEFPDVKSPTEAFEKLVAVACMNYEYVIVDTGSRLDLIGSSIFENCTTIFLITQVGITELRNANRLITQFFAARGRSLQVVLNRYTQRALLFDDSQIAKTLTRPADWKVPDDYAAARRTRHTATPLALVDSAISDAIRDLVRDAAEIPVENAKRGFFGLLR